MILKVIQYNAGRSSPNQHSILQQALEERTDIICLQEPFTYKNNRNDKNNPFLTLQHSAFTCYFPLSKNTRPRVTIYIRKATGILVVERLDLTTDTDLQILQVVVEGQPLYIVNLYNEKPLTPSTPTPTLTPTPTTVSRLLALDSLESISPLLLVGDFNLHHPLWNAAVTETAKIQKASLLATWLSRKQAACLVDYEVTSRKGGTYFRSNLRDTSIIDLAFYIGPGSISWDSWDYLPSSLADHEAITFTGYFPTSSSSSFSSPLSPNPLPPTTLPRYNYEKADWDAFATCIRLEGPALLDNIERADIESLVVLDRQAEGRLDSVTEALTLALFFFFFNSLLV